MNRRLLLISAATLLLTGACSGTDNEATDSAGPVTLVVNGLPPDTDPVNRANFQKDVAAFQDKYPDIKIDAREGMMDPQTFAAKLAGGQIEDVFYVYFTDPQGLIRKRQVADVSKQLADFPAIKQVKPELMRIFSDDAGKVYGLPSQNYSMGLVYNRDLFTKAGLDPDNPPKTWAEVRTAAQKLTAIGGGVVGYGDYSKSNTGGWHFTAETYSLGGDVATQDGEAWKASFNNATGKQVLQQLKDMRWTDRTMGEKQLLEYADLLRMMGGGKLGMYLGTGSDIVNIVNQYKGSFEKFGLGPMPDGKATLGGGDGYMFKAGLSPAKIKAGLTWLTWKNLDPARITETTRRASTNKEPVGLPQPNVWVPGSEPDKQLAAARKEFGNVPTGNFAPFEAAVGQIPLKLEPPLAQQVYAVLDVPMQKVLTDRDADVDALLAEAETQVNAVLGAAK
ncbi:extracellular solute-binding protein [Actinoplanes sp. NPDC051633]|uniref:ABC transporter substrate-binding protein n=1 Tax=Actinoplanes sp. NPDC051633 TaxID=3155670 RepID=UPI00341CBF8C